MRRPSALLHERAAEIVLRCEAAMLLNRFSVWTMTLQPSSSLGTLGLRSLSDWRPSPCFAFLYKVMRRRDTMRSMDTGFGWGRELLLLGLFLVGCTTTQHVGERGLPQKQGEASYYAEKFVGRATANGEIFDQEALTAAHRSLPFGTRVRVTRIDHVEEPSVVVRINDRGPFKRGRIIDLSKKAARRLQMIRDGIAEVRLKVVSYPAGMRAAAADSVATDSSGSNASGVGW